MALVAAASAVGWRLGSARREAVTATVVGVVDGDTIEVVRGTGSVDVVRLLGVDTPETVHRDRPVECHGPEASAFTRSRLLGRRVRLAFDAERRDAFGRLLAFVSVDRELFNETLLAEGYGRLLVVPPNGRHGRRLLHAQLDARRNGRGLWGSCAHDGLG